MIKFANFRLNAGIRIAQRPAKPVKTLALALLMAVPISGLAATDADRSSQPAPLQVGDVTQSLLSAQVDGRAAGGNLPMLGAAATVAYKRYLDSFSHPIPEHFQENVKSSGGQGGSSN